MLTAFILARLDALGIVFGPLRRLLELVASDARELEHDGNRFEAHTTTAELARRFEVSMRTIRRWHEELRALALDWLDVSGTPRGIVYLFTVSPPCHDSIRVVTYPGQRGDIPRTYPGHTPDKWVTEGGQRGDKGVTRNPPFHAGTISAHARASLRTSFLQKEESEPASKRACKLADSVNSDQDDFQDKAEHVGELPLDPAQQLERVIQEQLEHHGYQPASVMRLHQTTIPAILGTSMGIDQARVFVVSKLDDMMDEDNRPTHRKRWPKGTLLSALRDDAADWWADQASRVPLRGAVHRTPESPGAAVETHPTRADLPPKPSGWSWDYYAAMHGLSDAERVEVGL